MHSLLYPARATGAFSVGAGAVFTMIHTGHPLWALVTFLATAALTLLLLPRGSWRNGLDKPRLDRADMNSRVLLPVLAVLFLPSFLSPVLDFQQPRVWPVYFVAATGAVWLAFRAAAREEGRLAKQRMDRALEETAPEDATPERRDAAAKHADILQALQKLGAVDGMRARVWLLAQTLGRPTADLPGEISRLQRVGLVEVSTLDSGEDTTRHFVDMTPVGVRVFTELFRR